MIGSGENSVMELLFAAATAVSCTRETPGRMIRVRGNVIKLQPVRASLCGRPATQERLPNQGAPKEGRPYKVIDDGRELRRYNV